MHTRTHIHARTSTHARKCTRATYLNARNEFALMLWRATPLPFTLPHSWPHEPFRSKVLQDVCVYALPCPTLDYETRWVNESTGKMISRKSPLPQVLSKCMTYFEFLSNAWLQNHKTHLDSKIKVEDCQTNSRTTPKPYSRMPCDGTRKSHVSYS